MQSPKMPGLPLILQKKPPPKTVFLLYLENDKSYRKKSQTKVVDRKILHKNDLSLFCFC